MNRYEPKVIYVTAAAGLRLSICGYCRKITGDTTVIVSTPFYEIAGTEYPSKFEILNIQLKPVEQCTCAEDVLRGATVDHT